MKMKKFYLFITILIIFNITSFSTASAETYAYVPYQGYQYNDHNESIASPIGYVAVDKITGKKIGLDNEFKNLQGIYFDGNDSIYILESGANRIIETDSELHLKKIYDNFQYGGETLDFTGAQGFTVSKDNLFYIADTKNNRIIIADKQGEVKSFITRSDEVLSNTDMPFDVTKILIDRNDRIYAICSSINTGAFVFSRDGKFISFFGRNSVKATAEVIGNYFRKKFMTQKQIAGMKQVTPVNFVNFDIDKNGLIYTVTPENINTGDEKALGVLNYLGKDILQGGLKFGDLESDRQTGAKSLSTILADIDIDNDGFMNVLDIGRGKVFQYSNTGELVTVFGTYGQQMGSFEKPVAIESVASNIYVVDAEKACIYKFQPTDYTQKLREAILTLDDNDLSLSLNKWKAVMQMDTNSIYPYYGMGLAYDAQGKYKEAMENFKLSRAKREYSDSFREYRKEFVENNLPWIALATLMGLAALLILHKRLKPYFRKSNTFDTAPIENKHTYAFYSIFHPVDGFSEIKSKKLSSNTAVLIILVALFLMKSLEYFYTGFIFNQNTPADYNVFITLLQTFGLYILFVVSNWAVCTLFDGKGGLQDIAIVTDYSLLPYILFSLLKIILSNVFVLQESSLLSILMIIGFLWSGTLLVMGLYSIHQYSISRTVVSIVLTLIGIVICVLLIVLFYTLLQQVVNFIISYITEAQTR